MKLTLDLWVTQTGTARADAQPTRLLYVVCPGVRDYLEFGGAGILVSEEASVHASDWPYERCPLATECGPGWARVTPTSSLRSSSRVTRAR